MTIRELCDRLLAEYPEDLPVYVTVPYSGRWGRLDVVVSHEIDLPSDESPHTVAVMLDTTEQ